MILLCLSLRFGVSARKRFLSLAKTQRRRDAEKNRDANKLYVYFTLNINDLTEVRKLSL